MDGVNQKLVEGKVEERRQIRGAWIRTGLHSTSSFVGGTGSALGGFVDSGLLAVRCGLFGDLVGDVLASTMKWSDG